MPSADELKQRIEDAIPGARADVFGPDETHFSATVTAPEFSGLSRMELLRRVLAVLGDALGARIHALELKTRSE